MGLIRNEDQKTIRQMFAPLTNQVKVVVFTDKTNCQYCNDTKNIVDEVAALSEKITTEYHDLKAEPAVASVYGADRAPAIAVVRLAEDGTARDFGVRFYGIPSGYEFTTFIESIVLVSTGQAQLSPAMSAWLSKLDKPVHLQVFVTPTCPYCPQMVQLAHRLAVASDKVRADGVEATEFPELADKYSVYGVPRTVIEVPGGKDVHIEGSVPESRLLAELQKAAGSVGAGV